MTRSDTRSPSDAWRWSRDELAAHQVAKLNALLPRITQSNGLYRKKLGPKPPRIESLDELQTLPLTTKDELVDAAAAGEWLTRPGAEYVRHHQTSGTRGEPLVVPDTAEDWSWWVRTWGHTLEAAGIQRGDRALLAFSFGPFVGFWSAFDALVDNGVRAIPAGGMTSAARLELIRRTHANRLFCTPSYALHLASAAADAGVDAAATTIETVVVAGEPGGSVPATRDRIAAAWGARVVDHAGATEVGPWGFGDDLWSDPPGLRIVETAFIAEFLSVATGESAAAGELSHLILTNLGRVGVPTVRYRTGDLVRPEWPTEPPTGNAGEPGMRDGSPCRFVRLPGGVVGRADDMLVVRGVNVFPSSVEAVLNRIEGVGEWQLIATRRGEMDELAVEYEHPGDDSRPIAEALRTALGLRIETRRLAPGTLARTEHKARRLVDER